MKVTLHRCGARWVKLAHPCWTVEKALIDTNVDYDVVTSPGLPWQRNKRAALIEATGQNVFPAIVLEDGSVYREESADMAKKIRAGELGSSSPAQ
jgi:uncharacterized protein YbjT (DUF2867 family)